MKKRIQGIKYQKLPRRCTATLSIKIQSYPGTSSFLFFFLFYFLVYFVTLSQVALLIRLLHTKFLTMVSWSHQLHYFQNQNLPRLIKIYNEHVHHLTIQRDIRERPHCNLGHMPHFRINGDVETLKELSNFISSTYFGKAKVILWLASCYIDKKKSSVSTKPLWLPLDQKH